MTWSNPPAAVDALRTMLLACTTVSTAGWVSGSFHYPSAVLEADDATATDLPACVLAEDEHARTRYAEGANGMPSGTLSATFHKDTDAGTLELFARSTCTDILLVAQSSGLPISDARVQLASDPTPSARAADENNTDSKFRSITILITYGLRV